MSNIPLARDILKSVLHEVTDPLAKLGIECALEHMTKRKCDFRAAAKRPKLDAQQSVQAIMMRNAGDSLHDIADALGSSEGRVSEVTNPRW